MLGMSFTEIAIILVLALVLLGPDELPKVAKAVGKGLRELRRATDDLKSTFEQEIVKLDDDRPAGPMLVPPAYNPGSTSLDQLNDPGAARAAARAAAADPGAARAAARYQAAGLPPPAALVPPVAPAPLELPAAPADATASAAAPTAALPAAEQPPRAEAAASAATSDGPASRAEVTVEAEPEREPIVAAANGAPPAARPAPPGSVPREKKPGPPA